MTAQTKTITVNGATVHYLEAGPSDAQTVLLLHGNVGDAGFHWQTMLPELAEDFHLIAPDLPGFGSSTALNNVTYAGLLAWLGGLLTELDCKPTILVGNATGGLLARLYAAAYPDDVRALVLINGGGLPPKAPGLLKTLVNLPVLGNFFLTRTAASTVESRAALKWVVTDPDDKTIISDEMVTEATASARPLVDILRMQISDTLPENRKPDVPTLIVWGEDDELAPLSTGETLSRAIAKATLIPIAGTKQAPHIQEPEIIAYQIMQFLEKLTEPPPRNLPGVGILGGGT